MAVGTLLSRVTGLLRTAALAAALGVTSLADAYNIANTVPTILLVLVTGGTLSAVLVPLLVEADGIEERRRRAELLGALVLRVTLAASVLAAVVSPLLARLFAAGTAGQPGHDEFVQQTTLFLLVFAPQVLAYGVSVHAVAVLNASGRLALGAFASVATNVVTVATIAAYVLLRSDAADPADRHLLLLGVGTTLGVVVMAGIQVWGARRVLPGMRLLSRLRRDPLTDRVLRLGRWTVLYVVANQAGLAVVLIVAASVEGGASAYQWSFAVMQLPYAVVAVSVLSALYPRISRAALDDPARYAALIADALRVLLTLLLPAAVLMVVLAGPLTELLLGYGAVDGRGERLIAVAVAVFGVALLPFTAFQLLTRACYARGDARSPALVNVVVNVVNVVGAGIAGALPGLPTSILALLVGTHAASYVVGSALLAARLRQSAPGALAGLGGSAAQLTLPVLLTAVVAVGVLSALRNLSAAPEEGLVAALLQVVLVAAAALATYGIAVRLLARSAVTGLAVTPLRSPAKAGAPCAGATCASQE